MSRKWTEESVIDVIRESLSGCIAEGAHGLVDDAALLPKAESGATRVISCDAMQEGTDFSRELSSVDTAGHRAIIQNLSDLAATGASPVGFVWSLEVPELWLKKKAHLLRQFCDGAAKASKSAGLLFYGGDLSFSKKRFACAITILGDVDGLPLSRRGAKVGDAIYVSRPLGLSAYGLDVLRAGTAQKSAIEAHLWPSAEIELGKKLVGVAGACMDVSDGLTKDLSRLCKASEVGAELDNLSAALHPLLPRKKARQYALEGGEDYALLFTAASARRVPKGCIRIGRIIAEPRIWERSAKTRTPLSPQGYDHFASRV